MLEAFLKTVTEGYQAAHQEATAAVETARAALAEAEANLAKVELYNPDRKHVPAAVALAAPKPRGPSGPRAPRGEWQGKILAALDNETDGLPRADLISRLGVRGDKKGESAVSNALVSMKKDGKLGYDKGFYRRP
jgi:hypothetical protein